MRLTDVSCDQMSLNVCAEVWTNDYDTIHGLESISNEYDCLGYHVICWELVLNKIDKLQLHSKSNLLAIC